MWPRHWTLMAWRSPHCRTGCARWATRKKRTVDFNQSERWIWWPKGHEKWGCGVFHQVERFNQPKFGDFTKMNAERQQEWWQMMNQCITKNCFGVCYHSPAKVWMKQYEKTTSDVFCQRFLRTFLGCLRTELPKYTKMIISIGGFMVGSHETMYPVWRLQKIQPFKPIITPCWQNWRFFPWLATQTWDSSTTHNFAARIWMCSQEGRANTGIIRNMRSCVTFPSFWLEKLHFKYLFPWNTHFHIWSHTALGFVIKFAGHVETTTW